MKDLEMYASKYPSIDVSGNEPSHTGIAANLSPCFSTTKSKEIFFSDSSKKTGTQPCSQVTYHLV